MKLLVAAINLGLSALDRIGDARRFFAYAKWQMEALAEMEERDRG